MSVVHSGCKAVRESKTSADNNKNEHITAVFVALSILEKYVKSHI